MDEFNKLILDLKNIDGEDSALLLLCLLPETLDHFKKILLHGKEILSFEEIQTTLSSKELNEKFDVKVFSVGDNLVVSKVGCTCC